MNNPINNFDPFTDAKFDVEHSLNLYATSYCTFAAPQLYDEEFLANIRQTSRSFHIYLVGFTPKIEPDKPKYENGTLLMDVSYLEKKVGLRFHVPAGLKFIQTGEDCYFEDQHGQHRWIDPLAMMRQLGLAVGGCPFLVNYIGQAYGEDGSRDAIDRLIKHETLQKIAITGVPDGYVLQVVLLELQANNRVITAFLPNAKYKDNDGARRKMGLDKLFGTTESERVSLYEASLIRYFSPEFNIKFKNSFPSTNLEILQDCYNKDFLAVTAEICFDNFPFYLCSEKVDKSYRHIVTHNLQKDSERRVFFGMNS